MFSIVSVCQSAGVGVLKVPHVTKILHLFKRVHFGIPWFLPRSSSWLCSPLLCRQRLGPATRLGVCEGEGGGNYSIYLVTYEHESHVLLTILRLSDWKLTRIHSSRMHTAHCNGHFSWHACPPATHSPYHTCSPAMHVPLSCTPCHTCPCHACPLPPTPTCHAYPLPCMPPYHACPLPCMPPTTHAPHHAHPPLLTEFLTHACENFTLTQFRCGR